MRAVVMMLGLVFVASQAPAQAQTQKKEPMCKADRRGEELLTTIVYPDGYVVEGPWHVTLTKGQAGSHAITAVLDHIVEVQAYTNKREMTPLPGAIEMTFKGRTQESLLTEAAQMWCATIMSAVPPARAQSPSLAGGLRIT